MTSTDNEDVQYGSVEPNGYIAFMSLLDIIEVLGGFAIWLLIRLPYRIYRRYRPKRHGRHHA